MLAGGGLAVEEHVVVPEGLDDLPRVGTTFEARPGLDRLAWFGAGPHETYPDRRLARIGRYEASLDDLVVPYIWPQESGGRAEVRWLELVDAAGDGLRIVLDRPRQASVLPYRPEDLARADHHGDLVRLDRAVVHLDAAHRGVGTASCGPDTLPGYRIAPGSHRWAWSLEPMGPPRPTRARQGARGHDGRGQPAGDDEGTDGIGEPTEGDPEGDGIPTVVSSMWRSMVASPALFSRSLQSMAAWILVTSSVATLVTLRVQEVREAGVVDASRCRHAHAHERVGDPPRVDAERQR
ncbi:MAG: beta-galactosidase small subunit [Chloroflexota bacterium]